MNECKNGIVIKSEEMFGKMTLLDGAKTVYREGQQRGRREKEARMYRMDCEKMPDVQIEVYIKDEDKGTPVRYNPDTDGEKEYKLLDAYLEAVGTGRNVGFAVFAKDIVEA
ncbi:DUF961 family protein [Faecalicatena acetigenes]|uniref:DUF961 family protein n=1 Tax=Faecalicatena acetigenes TaxID=2981790 RepID=A0ABT2TB65_9FIRM|nr:MULTISPECIES: DUF961 family protein [Lachnospiraceae]MCU6747523.1 DUF961 family protein [Faecalicatena acetigenes]SCH93715.1 Uncharacterised protein [uncultured Clostridium sp.]